MNNIYTFENKMCTTYLTIFSCVTFIHPKKVNQKINKEKPLIQK